jgi:hypothetical protein
MRKEIAILKRVSYDPHIVQFYGACTTEPAMLVMEYMEVHWSRASVGVHCRVIRIHARATKLTS